MARGNEVRIVITSVDQTDKGFAAARAKAKIAGKGIADDIDSELKGAKPRIANTMGDTGREGGQSLANSLKGALRSNEQGIKQELAGLGDSGGKSFTSEFGKVVDETLPRHTKSRGTGGKIGRTLARDAEGIFGKEFSRSVTSGLPALMSPAGLAIGGVLAAVAAPVLAGALPLAAALGVGGIGLAVAAALDKDDPVIAGAIKKLHDHVMDMDMAPLNDNLTKAKAKLAADQAKLVKANKLNDSDKVKNSIKYDIEIDKQNIVKAQQAIDNGLNFNKLNRSLKDLAKPLVPVFSEAIDRITDLFDDLQPEIQKLFENLAPSVGPLMDVLTELAENIMPGLVGLAKTFSDTMKDPGVQKALKGLSETLGEFLTSLTKHQTEINIVFTLLINTITAALILIQSFIEWPGKIRNAFVAAFLYIQLIFLNIMLTIITGIGKIAGLAAKIPGPWQSSFKAIESDANKMAGKVQSDINKIHGKDVYINYIVTKVDVGTPQTHHDSYEHGGVVRAAASGGVRGGYTLVGEHGPELARLPAGSTVYSNAQSRGMLDRGNGGMQVMEHKFVFSGDSALGSMLMKMQREGQLKILSKAVVSQ